MCFIVIMLHECNMFDLQFYQMFEVQYPSTIAFHAIILKLVSTYVFVFFIKLMKTRVYRKIDLSENRVSNSNFLRRTVLTDFEFLPTNFMLKFSEIRTKIFVRK